MHLNNNIAILSLLNTPEVKCIKGSAEMNLNIAERHFHLESTLIDNENMKRKMSTLSNHIELHLNGIRKKLHSRST